MRTMFSAIILILICLTVNADPYEEQLAAHVPSRNLCSLEEFSSQENARKYIAQNGGELFKDQDTHRYQAIKCEQNIIGRVFIVSQMNDN